jgi:hypothetical protein
VAKEKTGPVHEGETAFLAASIFILFLQKVYNSFGPL